MLICESFKRVNNINISVSNLINRKLFSNLFFRNVIPCHKIDIITTSDRDKSVSNMLPFYHKENKSKIFHFLFFHFLMFVFLFFFFSFQEIQYSASAYERCLVILVSLVILITFLTLFTHLMVFNYLCNIIMFKPLSFLWHSLHQFEMDAWRELWGCLLTQKPPYNFPPTTRPSQESLVVLALALGIICPLQGQNFWWASNLKTALTKQKLLWWLW